MTLYSKPAEFRLELDSRSQARLCPRLDEAAFDAALQLKVLEKGLGRFEENSF